MVNGAQICTRLCGPSRLLFTQLNLTRSSRIYLACSVDPAPRTRIVKKVGSTSGQVFPDPFVPLSRGHVYQLNTYPTLDVLTPRLSTGAPTRSKREVITQHFYFTFLFIELVLLTAVASSIINIIPKILNNPISIPTILATNIPTSANYFFNYLIIQSLGFSGSVLFQYLRILYITTIWPVRILAQHWPTLELLNPISSIVVHANASRRSVAANNHPASSRSNKTLSFYKSSPWQMWGNVYSLFTNFAVIGMSSQQPCFKHFTDRAS